MRNVAKWSSWLALALLPLVFLLVGRRWPLTFLAGITAVPLFLTLAALHWPGRQWLRWTALVPNLLVTMIAVPAFIYMLMNMSAPPSLWATWPIVAAAQVLAIAPILNVLALFGRQAPAAFPADEAEALVEPPRA